MKQLVDQGEITAGLINTENKLFAALILNTIN